MNFQDLLHFSDLLGTFAFAISGALVAVRKKMDIFGVLVLSVVTATGGGTLRSVLIGDNPVFILKDLNYLLVSVLGGLVVFYFRDSIKRRQDKVLIFDAFGLAIFLNIGTSVGLQHHLGYWASILLGMVTATFGGVIRDIMSSEIPLIFQKELYASLTLVGGILYVLLYHFNVSQAYIVVLVSALVFTLRVLSLQRNWSLPK